MAFDPNLPAPSAPILSAELRAQFNALKALIDTMQASMNAGIVPVGGVMAWMKSLSGAPALPASFVECNGRVLNDGGSPFDGQTMPDLNGTQRFLRGATASGGTGGSENHSHMVDLTSLSAGDPGSSGGMTVHQDIYPTSDASTLPPYYEVVYVMRIK